MRHDFGVWKAGHSGLREPSSMAFPAYAYYLAMVFDLCGRVSWTLTISPHILSSR
jgi:hypothetical protein